MRTISSKPSPPSSVKVTKNRAKRLGLLNQALGEGAQRDRRGACPAPREREGQREPDNSIFGTVGRQPGHFDFGRMPGVGRGRFGRKRYSYRALGKQHRGAHSFERR